MQYDKRKNFSHLYTYKERLLPLIYLHMYIYIQLSKPYAQTLNFNQKRKKKSRKKVFLPCHGTFTSKIYTRNLEENLKNFFANFGQKFAKCRSESFWQLFKVVCIQSHRIPPQVFLISLVQFHVQLSRFLLLRDP